MAKKKAATPSAAKPKSKKSSSSGIKNIWAKILRFCLKTVLFFFVSTFLVALLYRFVPVPFTPLMFIRAAQQVKNGKSIKMKKDWVSIDEAGPMPTAAMAGEDAKFMDHVGFDFEAIGKAIEHNKNHKKKKGASTISQQTAKNVFLWDGRTWIRKGLEVYFTLLIELLWSKERILEVYINVAEMGDGIYGVEAASRAYYNKPANKMSRLEAAKIAAILPSPLKWSVKKPSMYVAKRQNWIRKNMDYIKEIDF